MLIGLIKFPPCRTFCFPDVFLKFSVLAEARWRHGIYVSKDARIIRSIRDLKLGESWILYNRVLDENWCCSCWNWGRSDIICRRLSSVVIQDLVVTWLCCLIVRRLVQSCDVRYLLAYPKLTYLRFLPEWVNHAFDMGVEIALVH